jgi:hypothetical protein
MVVIGRQGVSARTIAASLLVLSFMVFAVGGILYTGRAMWHWHIEDLSAYLVRERGFVIAATLATVLGLALLGDLLRDAGDAVSARLGVVTYAVGATLVLVAETTYLIKREWNYAQIVLYVILAFLAQAVLGVALLQTGLVAGWVGWTSVLWNLACLLVMAIVRPRDVYFPALHFVAPLVIGLALIAETGV